MSRKTRSGRSVSIAFTASGPLPASPTTVISASERSHTRKPLRASGSSSAITAEIVLDGTGVGSVSRAGVLVVGRIGYSPSRRVCRDPEGNPDRHAGAAAGCIETVDLLRRTIELLQARTCVHQADAIAAMAAGGCEARTRVAYFEPQRTLLAERGNHHAARAGVGGDAMDDRVLDQRLQDHARHDRVEHIRLDVVGNDQSIGKAHALDAKITLDELELARQRDLLWPVVAQRHAQQLAQPSYGLHDGFMISL